MKKTLLLCFIHGFKGGDDTFGNFPQHLQALLGHALPKVNVRTITYPKYETRGDLRECVARFKEWLQNKIIDLEIAAGTPSPTIDPSVHTVLVGHSMGGIVAAEALLSVTSEQPIPSASTISSAADIDDATQLPTSMFPYIQGILAFDTPYLGIAPGVVAHGAEENWNSASAAYSTYTSVTSAFGWGGSTKAESEASVIEASKALPEPEPSTQPARKTPPSSWGKWGKIAMVAGAAGALAAGGAAAYMKRDTLSGGWTWVGSHLEFVGCLARGEELRQRLSAVINLRDMYGLGFADLHTCLGAGVDGRSKWSTGVLGSQRTFCILPKGELGKYFFAMTNDRATDEISAHMNMFTAASNPGYYTMSEKAKELVAEWVMNEWYEESENEELRLGKDGEAEGADIQ